MAFVVIGADLLREAFKRKRQGLRNEIRTAVRESAKILRREYKRGIRAEFGPGTRAERSIRFRTRSRVDRITAFVGPRGIQRAYLTVLNRGGTVERRGHKRTFRNGIRRVRAHTANYGRPRRFVERAVERTRPLALAKIGEALEFKLPAVRRR